jgi:hypothetical protein
MKPLGIRLTANAVRPAPAAVPVEGLYRVSPGMELKFPFKVPATGTVEICVLSPRLYWPSQEPKKKTLSLIIGPPALIPNWL